MDEPRIALPAGSGDYRVATKVRVFATLLAALAWLIAWVMLRMSSARDPVAWAFVLVAALPALWFAFVAWTSRLHLDARVLALRHPLGRRELRLTELRGVRIRHSRYGRSLTIFQPRRGRTLALVLPYATDRYYEGWLARLPDLDAIDLAASAQALLADPRLGASTGERVRRLAHWTRIARWLNVATVLLLGWALVFPHPYAWLLGALVSAPWLALLLVWWSGGLLRTSLGAGDVRPLALSPLLGGPMLILMRTASDLDLLSWGGAWCLGVLAGLPLWLAILGLQRAGERRPGASLFYFALCWLYGTGAAVAGNVLSDRATPQAYPAMVVGKHAVHGKHATYKLRLGGALPAGHDDWYEVSAGRYEATPVGGTVCVWRHPGRLRVPWVTVARCGN
ncbi:hypothetical protein QMK61_11220 [Fulvimonas sp. R45]|uniref:hypothetical protein n=1 Tax=Fulvimonas sp. R45 TaxID=3045937 RepID=UPI00265F619C|nr:hypothetical protein [Fulvimonas sp. R45]MDO1529399.1 hypothetical protein [Fulvimonas sp. R45]